ncbi:MAG: dienelactone hydrolase family protein, partial [Xanthomonas perforans]|nr:dienelactone hydrolase family protein [Xanthomonas perforans]
MVIQEIFGVNEHIRAVADDYAARGYEVLAPAFFDLEEKDVQLPYDQESLQRGLALANAVGLERAVEVVKSAATLLGRAGKVGTVGYCWGGSVALLSAIRLGLPSVSYYGGRNTQLLDETPKAPVMFHFGEQDTSIPPEAIQAHREKLPQMETFVYPTGHAFNRSIDPTHYDADSAERALERTLGFFE